MRNFLSKTLAEMNPDLSISAKTVEYFSQLFSQFIMDKAVFDYWQVKNNRVDFAGWPEAVKMDYFMESAWDSKGYEQQLTFLYK